MESNVEWLLYSPLSWKEFGALVCQGWETTGRASQFWEEEFALKPAAHPNSTPAPSPYALPPGFGLAHSWWLAHQPQLSLNSQSPPLTHNFFPLWSLRPSFHFPYFDLPKRSLVWTKGSPVPCQVLFMFNPFWEVATVLIGWALYHSGCWIFSILPLPAAFYFVSIYRFLLYPV